jgi:hypothetical protein
MMQTSRVSDQSHPDSEEARNLGAQYSILTGRRYEFATILTRLITRLRAMKVAEGRDMEDGEGGLDEEGGGGKGGGGDMEDGEGGLDEEGDTSMVMVRPGI